MHRGRKPTPSKKCSGSIDKFPRGVGTGSSSRSSSGSGSRALHPAFAVFRSSDTDDRAAARLTPFCPLAVTAGHSNGVKGASRAESQVTVRIISNVKSDAPF